SAMSPVTLRIWDHAAASPVASGRCGPSSSGSRRRATAAAAANNAAAAMRVAVSWNAASWKKRPMRSPRAAPSTADTPPRGGQRPSVRNDFGQTRRQRGEEEPVHREGEEGEYVYAGGDPFGGHDEGDDDGEDRPGEVAIQQHLAPSPPIEERPGEGPNDREL